MTEKSFCSVLVIAVQPKYADRKLHSAKYGSLSLH